jgi:membrane associated rhomboid family serine protease
MTRLILWTIAMAYVGFLLVGRGSYLPLGVTISGALIGAGSGSILAAMFSSRVRRKHYR